MEVSMSFDDHVSALRARHADLQTRLDEEQGHAHPDDTVIAELKKQKLRIKDELAALETA